MTDLKDGILKFRKQEFEANKEHFTSLGRRQNPHTLFIGCSDSRVVPTLITQTMPGELFIVRNIANIVPPWRESEEYLATTSAIEYAVQILNVKNIIVCGHSNCGGCAALWESPVKLEKIPHTRRWLELAAQVTVRVNNALSEQDFHAREWLTEQYNVVEQLGHLMTYPYIREHVEQKTLEILGWHYLIHTGDIYQYNASGGHFELLNQ